MRTSDEVSEIAKALCKLQSSLKTLTKDTQAFKYKYTTLDSVWEEIRPLLGENGIYIAQDAQTQQEGVSISTTLFHVSGQYIEFGPLLIPMGKNDAHSTGSGITYGKRYQLCAALGIVSGDDDDGQKAQASGPANKPIKKMYASVDFAGWVNKQAKKFDKPSVEEYISEASKVYQLSEQETVNKLADDEELFEKNFVTWLTRKEKDSPSSE